MDCLVAAVLAVSAMLSHSTGPGIRGTMDSIQAILNSTPICSWVSDVSDVLILRLGKPGERVDAAKRLGRKQFIAAIPALVAALDDEESIVRTFAAGALGRIGDG